MLKNYLLLAAFFSLGPSESFAQTWNQKANVPTIARHRCSSFSIGNKGYVGLGHLNTVSNILFDDLWEYNPASNTWTQKADFAGGLRYHCHAFAINGKAYVGTGRDGSSYQNDNWEYDPTTNTWAAKADIPGPNRRGTVSFVINNLGYVGSGFTSSGGSGTSNDFYAYDPALDSWSTVASFPGTARNSAVGFAIDSMGYMGTGDPHGLAQGLNDFWEYNSVTDAWTQKANVSDSIRRQSAGFALNGYGYIGTGHNPNIDDDMDDFWQYIPATDSWVQVEDFLGVSRRYTTTFVIAGKAYASMGTNGINFTDLWEYNPNYLVAFNYIDEVGLLANKKSSGTYAFKQGPAVTPTDLKLFIFNMDGKIIHKELITSSELEIAPDQFPPNSVYKVIAGTKVIKAGKLKLTK